MMKRISRLITLILPLAYYFSRRANVLLLNGAILAAVLSVICLKYYFNIKLRPKFVNKIFSPELKFLFLCGACFLSILFFNKIIAMNVMLFVILGNTFADVAREHYGRLGELVVFLYVGLSSSLFILLFPFVLDWRVALFGCFAGAIIRTIKLPVNKDISVGFVSGAMMSLLLIPAFI